MSTRRKVLIGVGVYLAVTIAIVAAFGWTLRGRDVTEVVGPAMAVSYAAYIGLAFARVPQSSAIIVHWALVPLSHQWPAAVIGGLPFALIFAIFIAVPVSWIPLRHGTGPAVEDRLGTFIKEYDVVRLRQRDEAGPRPSSP